MKQIFSKIEKAQKIIKNAKIELDKIRANKRIKCCCGKTHAIKSFTLIVTHWYVEPYSCTGGDYWKEGEWNIIGPCGINNRLLFNDYDVDYDKRDRIDIAAEPTFKYLYDKKLWKSVIEEYEKHNKRPNNINYYVDKNRKKFELPEVVK